MAIDLDLQDLTEVRRRVVDPVLSALFRPGELKSADLRREEDASALHRLWLTLVDQDNDTLFLGLGGGPWGQPVNATDLADELATEVADAISETSYGWGEQRVFRGPLPKPSHNLL